MQSDQFLSEPVIKEVLLETSPSRVWKALTNKEELKQWCFDMDAFEPKEGFEFHFWGENEGERFLHNCKVVEADPERRIKWLWSYEGIPGDTFVTFELIPEAEDTRLKLTHEGLEKLPQDKNYAKENFIAGWNEILGKLLVEYVKTYK